MNDLEQRKLEEKINYGYDFHLSGYISDAFAIFKKETGLFIGVTVLIMIVYGVLAGVGGGALLSFIMPAMYAGFYLVGDRLHHNEHVEFRDFFKGFDFFVPLLVSTLIMSLIYIACMIPAIIAGAAAFISMDVMGGGDISPEMATSTILLVVGLLLLTTIPVIYLSVAWMFAPLFIVFYKMDFWPAMQMSRKLVHKRWFTFFGFTLVLSLMNMAGILCLLVGLLVTIPVSLLATYTAFADITRFAEDQENDVMDHLVM